MMIDERMMTRENRPVRVTAKLPLGIGSRNAWSNDTDYEIAAPVLDGPQHAPGHRGSSKECEWKRGELSLTILPDSINGNGRNADM